MKNITIEFCEYVLNPDVPHSRSKEQEAIIVHTPVSQTKHASRDLVDKHKKTDMIIHKRILFAHIKYIYFKFSLRV